MGQDIPVSRLKSTAETRPSSSSNPSPKPEAADIIVAYLEQLGVEYVFGVPGGAIEPLFNALARSARRGGPRVVVARHETGAAFMADGYARNSGRLGVCCATTGPGATNLITGVASAYENHIPLLVITAQTALASFGRGALQESSCTGVNTVGMFEYCTRYNTLVSHPDQLEPKLSAAIMAAFQTPVGPSHISLPLDLLRSPATVAAPSYDLASLLQADKVYDPEAIAVLKEELAQARGVVFVIGEGAGEAIGTILEIALAIGAKLVVTPHGKGFVSPYHPLFRGVIGFAGHTSAIQALLDPNVDTVIAVGTALTESATDGWNADLILNRRLIHIDAIESNLTKSPMARLHVRGHLASIFDELARRMKAADIYSLVPPKNELRQEQSKPPRVAQLRRLPNVELEDAAKHEDDSTPIKPQRLMHDLTRLFPPHTHYLVDSGNSMTWAIHYLHPYDRRLAGRRDVKGSIFWAPLEFASMGWAIGASIGAALAKPETPIVCITGDGSVLMSGQELTVAIEQGLTVIFVILNDSALGMVKHGQRLSGAEPIGFQLPRVDFAALAGALGAQGLVIESPADLEALDIPTLCARRGPTVLDIRVDPEEIPPMASRIRMLNTSAEDAKVSH
ncbi:MAG: thiamine pyrophosphate-binding protein [Gammaproteobacteria bacterium]|nr:thiamine pyrophosphate-binding protein [Gammaproteobacteria bacterium]